MTPRRHSIPVRNNPETRNTHELVAYDWGNPDANIVTICVHGLTRNAHDFDVLAQALADTGRRVLAINMAGRGESAWLPDPMDYSYATYVADCLAVMDNFHLRGVEWIGTSMGGIIGMMIAAQQTGRIKKLILNDIGTLLSREALTRIYGYVATMPKRFATREEADAYLAETFKSFGITDPLQWQQFVDGSLLPDTDGSFRYACDPAIAQPLRAATKNFTDIDDIDLTEIWEEVRIPALIIRGAESDILSAATVHHMRLSHLRAQTVTIPDVGHAPALMSAEQIDIVKRWLIEGSNKASVFR
jgi:pimeloyl-ACP methyl ester carboxylesterase